VASGLARVSPTSRTERYLRKHDRSQGIEVTRDGKTLQMSLLREHANHVERIPHSSSGQSKTEEVQELLP
jgi:hypothetical protein